MKKIYLLLLFAGIVLRFLFHFIFPTFNGDEIALGNNIKYSNYIELLYPLKFGQSSPPLYLLLQKFIISFSPFSFWISIKILSFISSVTGVIFFYLLMRKYQFKIAFLILFIIILFNPFIVSNSLTVKQYTIDLTGIILLIFFYKSNWFLRYGWIFFMIWGLFSNIGLFACAGYLLFVYLTQKSYLNFESLVIFLKSNLLTFLAPFPYIVYFIWYMNQDGAAEMKSYMVNYWNDSFIPLDLSIFKYLIYTVHGLWIFLLNSFEIWGIFLMLLMIPFFLNLKNKNLLFKQEILLLFSILFVHLVLNICQLYPFSDRLYLYLSPLFLLILGSSISKLIEYEVFKKKSNIFLVIISITTLSLYMAYTPSNDNDVVKLYSKLINLEEKNIYLTEKSMECINSFNDFTDDEFKKKIIFEPLDLSLQKSKYIVSRVGKKIKYNVSSPEEEIIQNLINKEKIVKLNSVNGYNIYLINSH